MSSQRHCGSRQKCKRWVRTRGAFIQTHSLREYVAIYHSSDACTVSQIITQSPNTNIQSSLIRGDCRTCGGSDKYWILTVPTRGEKSSANTVIEAVRWSSPWRSTWTVSICFFTTKQTQTNYSSDFRTSPKDNEYWIVTSTSYEGLNVLKVVLKFIRSNKDFLLGPST